MSALLGVFSILLFACALIATIVMAISKNPKWKLCLIGVVAGFALFIVAVSMPNDKPVQTDNKAPKVEHSKIAAYAMAQEFVDKQLKAPSTSKYPVYSEKFVKDLGEGRYTVTTYVDAQNSFGAMIRNNFTCTLLYVGNDKWQLEDINIE